VTTRARHAASLATLLGIAGTSPPSAAEPACEPVAVETGAGLNARWPDLQERIRQALDGRDDVDVCAHITLRLEQSAIVVEVVLPDGRSAFRSVSRREDVVPTLEALLLLPRERARAEHSRASRPVSAVVAVDRTPASAAAASVLVSERAAPPTSEPELARRVRIELSVISGARVGDGQLGASLGVLTSVDIAGWLVGFAGTANHYAPVTGGPSADALQLAASAGRRFRFGDTSLDLTAGPALATHGFGSSFTARAGDGEVPAAGTPPPPRVSDQPSVRIHGGARVSFRARAFLRPFAGLEADFALTQPIDLPPEEPRLPTWTAGLVVGATMGTP
jgi:hypothetical protein